MEKVLSQHPIKEKPELIGDFLDVHYNILEFPTKSGSRGFEAWLTIPSFIDKPTMYDLFGSPISYSTFKGRTKVLYLISGVDAGEALEAVKHMIRILT